VVSDGGRTTPSAPLVQFRPGWLSCWSAPPGAAFVEPDSRYRTLRAVGMGAESVSELIVGSLGDRPGLTVREVAPGRISVARTRRPRWAVIACACTFWLGGLGFLFLLVRQTEAGEITVSDGPQGCVVVLPSVLAGP